MIDPVWQDAVDAFLLENKSATSRETYHSILYTFLRDLGLVSPDAVTDATIAAFLAEGSHAPQNRGKAVSPTTYRRRIGILTRFYRFAQTFLVDGTPLYQKGLPAILAAWQLRPAVASDGPPPFSHFPPEWREATEQFLSSLWERSGSDATVESYTLVLRRFFAAPRTPQQATRADVLSFLAQKSQSKRNAGQPVAPATRNARLCTLISFYRWASNWLIPGTDTFLWQGIPPVQGISYGKPDEHYRAMSEEELEKFFLALSDSSVISLRDKSIFVTFLACARRRNELVALKWGDISEGMLTDPNGHKRRGYLYTFRGKGHKRMLDTQELPEYAYAAIIAYLEASGRLATIGPDDPVWISTHPGQGRKDTLANLPLHDDYINTRFHQICQRAGIEDREGLSLHSWRHSSVLHRYALGEDILSLKRLLRHSSLQTTDKYLRQLAGEADPGAERLRARFAFLR